MQPLSDDIRELFETIDASCDFFLENINEKSSLSDAAPKLAPILGQASEVVKKTRPESMDCMLEIANHTIENSATGGQACARVGVNQDKNLVLLFTPVGCEGLHVIPGQAPRLVNLHELSQIGFTPFGMVSSLKKFVSDILVDTLINMPGADA